MTAERLTYVGAAELARLRQVTDDPVARAGLVADACRLNTLSMIAEAGSGHIGTSFSCMDLLCWLHLEVLGDGDRSFSSKGHDAPGLYSVLVATGSLEFDELHALRRLGGLPGHPDVRTTPQVHTNTGSLGMGVSKARGFILADRLAGRSGRVYVLTGDGELQEGQFWESLQPTANRGLGELTVIVDHNKLQSDTWVSEVSDLGDLERKVAAFGWAVGRCDGHDLRAVRDALARLDADGGATVPKLLIADTVKGKGVSFMEPHDLPAAGDSLYDFHSGAPTPDEYVRGVAELRGRIEDRLAATGAGPLVVEQVEHVRAQPPRAPQRLVAAYGRALTALGEQTPELVALDGDLSLDTGLVEFRARFPERFVECGIAEQDMVSQAGAMALAGALPIVHSFACFLTPRANEQIFNNASEQTKVVYAGSLAGIVPGGPGHSHQSVRDIALMGCVPGIAMIEPAFEAEAELALRWAVEEATGPVYVRLVSVPWQLGFDAPAIDRLEPGRGTVLREGDDALLVATGPVLISQAWAAAAALAERGVSAGVVALPWLSDVDGAWLAEVAGSAAVVTIDNHLLVGGQGDAVLRALATEAPAAAARVHRVGVTRVPSCGTNLEVLRDHGLDAGSLVERVVDAVGAGVGAA